MAAFRLASISGFEIRIDHSWFVIFFLILWTFTTGVFPAAYPGLDTPTYIGMGVSGTLLFFASVLGHELSHSVVARSKGIPVEGITLFIFGGMAHTRMEFEKPGDEFQIAGIGPLSSLLIAGLFWLVAWGGGQVGWPVAVTGVASYLATINVALAVFNLLPGFPLDGGRLFRAGVWKITGDLAKATRWASMGGKVLGYLLVGFGLVNVFAGNLVGGLWLVFIGWFVQVAAASSYAQYLLGRSLEGVSAGEIMTPDPVTVPPEVSLQDFIEDHVFQGRHQSYPVVEEGRPVGIITLNQVKQVPREDWPQRTVRDAMAYAGSGMIARPEESMSRVLQQLGQSSARRVLVTRNGQLAGIITPADVARWLERARLVEGK
jgi:Zn-dependent protease/CBS domain-containing protein